MNSAYASIGTGKWIIERSNQGSEANTLNFYISSGARCTGWWQREKRHKHNFSSWKHRCWTFNDAKSQLKIFIFFNLSAIVSSTNNFLKVWKLFQPANFCRWRRQVHAIMSHKNLALLCFQNIPFQSSTKKCKEWQLCNAKAKSTIVLCLRYKALAKTHKPSDDFFVSEKILWD